jgi:hypothetical protein
MQHATVSATDYQSCSTDLGVIGVDTSALSEGPKVDIEFGASAVLDQQQATKHGPLLPNIGAHGIYRAITYGEIPGCDFVTVMTSKGPRLTKRIFCHPDGTLGQDSYENAKHFGFRVRLVCGLN